VTVSTLVNLTPHPIRIYSPDLPDRIDPADHEPVQVIEPSTDHKPARIGEVSLGTQNLGIGVPVEYVEYTSHGGLVNPLPAEDEHDPHRTWYIVPLIVALSQGYINDTRSDLLVPYREVRNLDGTVIGCRLLARPV
jgi:hypothetical protein